MTITYRTTSHFPRDVLITSVHCVICRGFVTTGQYTIAPAESVYAGKPICARCIDMATSHTQASGEAIGPSETKSAGDESDGSGWHDS